MTPIYTPSTFWKGRAAELTVRFLTASLFLSIIFWVNAAGAEKTVTLKFDVKASYTLGSGDSKVLAHKLAVFRAKYIAAEKAARQFEEKRWIQFENGDRDELTALVAEGLSYDILAEKWQREKEQSTYVVDLQTVVSLSDFIDAQLQILDMAHEMANEDLRHEMEPPLSELLKPGRALAKAYWLMRINEIRMAIIYLDGLIQQYPNWQEVREVKKLALQHQQQLSVKDDELRRSNARTVPML